MIVKENIIDRVLAMVESEGVRSALGAKTTSWGDLRNVPESTDGLDSWLPAILVSITRADYAQDISSGSRGMLNPLHNLVIYYIRRYEQNEIVDKVNTENMKVLHRLFRDRHWGDRMETGIGSMARVGYLREARLVADDYRPDEAAEIELQQSRIAVISLTAQIDCAAMR